MALLAWGCQLIFLKIKPLSSGSSLSVGLSLMSVSQLAVSEQDGLGLAPSCCSSDYSPESYLQFPRF